MELELTRETLRFEQYAGRVAEQVTIEGEATLPGSMRDAVTVLSVQAHAYLDGTQAGNGEVGVRGSVCFQVLYTQGDLTRIRALETTCSFTHRIPFAAAAPQMRIRAHAAVQETDGEAASGRMRLRALLEITAEAFAAGEENVIASAAEKGGGKENLQTRMQSLETCAADVLGEGKALAREEFDLPDRLGAGDVLFAWAHARADDFSGGNGRISVSGVIELRVIHRPKDGSGALVTTVHELPYEAPVDARAEEGGQIRAQVEVTDVMADSAPREKGRILRAEAEVRVVLSTCRSREVQLLEDLYSLRGPVLEPLTKTLNIHTAETRTQARESLRVQAALPPDAPPIDQVLAVFANPVLTGLTPAGRRLDTEGLLGITLIYLPVDSDIPYAVHTREPFALTFPVAAGEDVHAEIETIEAAAGPTASDRAEIRCVLGLCAVQHGTKSVRVVTDIEQGPEEKKEHGFVLVWPEEGETRWETARRLRVEPSALRPAGGHALLALRR